MRVTCLCIVACQELDPKASHSRAPGTIPMHVSWVKTSVRGNLQFNWTLWQWVAESSLKQINCRNRELQFLWIEALQGLSTLAWLMFHTVPTFTLQSANPLKLCEHRRHIFKRNSFRSIWNQARVGMTKSSEVPFQSWHFSQHLDEGAQQKSAPSRRWGAMGRWMVGVFNSRRQTGREGRGHWTSVFCAFGLGREKKTVNHYWIRYNKVASCHIRSTPSQHADHAEGTQAVTIQCPLLFPGLKPKSPTEGWKVPWRCLCVCVCVWLAFSKGPAIFLMQIMSKNLAFMAGSLQDVHHKRAGVNNVLAIWT